MYMWIFMVQIILFRGSEVITGENTSLTDGQTDRAKTYNSKVFYT